MNIQGHTALVTDAGSGQRDITGKDGNGSPLEDFVRVINVNLIGSNNASRMAPR